MEFDDRLPTDGVNVSPEHPLRELAVLLGGLLAVVLGLGVVAALAVDWIVPRLPPGVEMALFGGLAPEPGDAAPRTRAPRACRRCSTASRPTGPRPPMRSAWT